MKKIFFTFFAIALSVGVFAQQRDTMFIHMNNQFIHEFATHEIDSIIFERTQPRMVVPCDSINIIDSIVIRDSINIIDSVVIRDSINIIDSIVIRDSINIIDSIVIRDSINIIDSIAPPLPPHPMVRCSENAPLWGANLGAVSFSTDTEWTIEGHGISQIWSDAVIAEACNKTTFNGGSSMGPFFADCRSNISGVRGSGDMFSWCAVVRFREVLCPHPWRVPTEQDFINLDLAMGGNGINRSTAMNDPFMTENYIIRWGGVLWADNNRFAHYWSQCDHPTGTDQGFELRFGQGGGQWDQPTINPNRLQHKSTGRVLRCVR